jgi:hypothetical protein
VVVKMIFEAEIECFFINHFWHGVFTILLGLYILLMAKIYNIDIIVLVMMGVVSAAAAFSGIGILIVTDETRD